MAFGFFYQATLIIRHEFMEPMEITQQLTLLRPTIAVKAGDLQPSKEGEQSFPPRKFLWTIWSAPLHKQERCYSEDMPLSEFLRDQLDALSKHRDLFHFIRNHGEVIIAIDWFGDTHHSGGMLEYDILAACGTLQIDIDLSIYGERPQVPDRGRFSD